MVIGQQDPLIGSLPQNNTSGSPALAGQPATIAGAGSTPAVPTPQMQGGPALAPAPPESGSADIGAPLPSDAPEQQAGAGANLDLVQDRGKPMDYWNKNLQTLGSKESLKLIGDAATGSSGKTGQFAEMDPEEVRRQGAKVNKMLGIDSAEAQDKAVEELVYAPMTNLIRNEVKQGVTTEDEGVMRMVMTMAQVEGPQNEDELADIVAMARAAIGGE